MSTELETAIALELFKERAAKVCEETYPEPTFNGVPVYFHYAYPKDAAAALRALPTSDLAAEAKRIIKDAALGRLVRSKMVSGNSVPVERCVITAREISDIDAAKERDK